MFVRGILICLAACSVAACASLSGFPDYPVNPEADLFVLKTFFDPGRIVHYLNFRGDRTSLRNEIIYGRIAAYDIEFAKFQQDIEKERALTDTTGDLTALLLSALGASLVSQATKTALAASVTAVTGAKASIDKNVFYDKTLPALFAQMDANRATAYLNIKTCVTKPDSGCPLTEAMVYLNAYRDAGSIPGALTAISQAAGVQKDLAVRMVRGF
jgi:hypothetical protein